MSLSREDGSAPAPRWSAKAEVEAVVEAVAVAVAGGPESAAEAAVEWTTHRGNDATTIGADSSGYAAGLVGWWCFGGSAA